MIPLNLATQNVINWIESCEDESQLDSCHRFFLFHFIRVFKPSCIIESIINESIINKLKSLNLRKCPTKKSSSL